jgi:ADP-ribose pyrophosphatase YjhB (NUDIX family)
MAAKGQVVKAMVLIQRPADGALLVLEGTSPAGEQFHRLLGGHVELGERALQAIHREIGEEIGQALTGVRLAGVVENIFDWDGTLGHEVVFVYTAAFADESAYGIQEQWVQDAVPPVRVVWRPAGVSGPPLYPDGVADLAAESMH